MKRRGRIIPFLLTVCLIAGLLPQAAFAQSAETQTGSPAIVLGASQIEGGQKSSVYFGTYPQSSDGNGSYTTEPIKWRVLSNKSKGINPDGTQTELSWTEGEGLLLLSDKNLDVSSYSSSNADPWDKSSLRTWLNDGFIKTAFSEMEEGALLTTQLKNWETENNNANQVTQDWSDTNDTVFILSVREALNAAYGFNTGTGDNDARKVDNTDYVNKGGHLQATNHRGDHSLLRTGQLGNIVWYVFCSEGYMSNVLKTDVCCIRPAFNLDLSKVLFTSPAADGELSGTGLSKIGTANTAEWKVTLKDDTRSGFRVTDPKPAAAQSGGTVEISYSGAKADGNEYVSAILTDSNGSPLYYGHIAQNSASGTASVTMPADLAEGAYTLKVFSQQCNGAEMTDYASDFADVQITIDNTRPTLTAGTPQRTSKTAATVTFTSSEAGSYYYEVVEQGASGPDINTSGSGTACSVGDNTISLSTLTDEAAKDIYIAVKDAAGNVSSQLKIEIPAYEASTDPSTEPENPSTDPTDPSTDPTEPSTDPTNPTVPTNPTNPTDPTRPTNPTGPTSPALPVHQHSFGSWTVTAAATCTEAGKEERVCATCGQKETREIPAAGHDWNADYTADKEPTCTEAGSRSIHCRNCDAQQNAQAIPALGHSFTKYVSDGNAAINQDGTETAKCDRCEVTDTRIEQGSALTRQPGTSQQEQAQKLFVKTKPVLKLETISASKIKVSWNAVKGAKGYAIYRADSKNGKYKRIKTISTAKTRSFIDGKRQAGKSYSYKVRAYQKDKSGKTIWSAASKTATQKAAPAAPKQVKAAAKKGYAAVAWKTVKGADKYRVYRCTEKNGKYIRMWETVHPTFQDKKVKAGRTYYYKVAALKQNGKTKIRGAASGIVKVTIK